MCTNRKLVIKRTQLVSKRVGFSLVELLVVLGIMVMTATLIAPGSVSMVQSWRLDAAGRAIVDRLSMARLTAITKNRAVEVRFYQYGDRTQGENADDPGTGKYRAVGLLEVSEAGKYRPLGKVERLASGVIVDQNTQLTSLFGFGGGPKAGNESYGTIPDVGTRYNFIAFQFLPDGGTNLKPTASRWFLSLHDIRGGDSLSKLPANYCTVQIDPSNGHIKTYRP